MLNNVQQWLSLWKIKAKMAKNLWVYRKHFDTSRLITKSDGGAKGERRPARWITVHVKTSARVFQTESVSFSLLFEQWAFNVPWIRSSATDQISGRPSSIPSTLYIYIPLTVGARASKRLIIPFRKICHSSFGAKNLLCYRICSGLPLIS